MSDSTVSNDFFKSNVNPCHSLVPSLKNWPTLFPASSGSLLNEKPLPEKALKLSDTSEKSKGISWVKESCEINSKANEEKMCLIFNIEKFYIVTKFTVDMFTVL